MWRALALVCALLFASPALAQTQSTGGGYAWPDNLGTSCSPLCVGAAATWTVPTLSHDAGVSGGNQSLFQWIGISSFGPGTLAQMGTEPTVTSGGGLSCRGWWEQFGVNAATTIPGFPCAAGDVISGEIECTANCVNNGGSQSWTFTLINVTQAHTSTLFFTGWTAGLTYTLWGNEPAGGITPTFTDIAFSGAKVNQGSGLQPIAVTPPMNTYAVNGAGAAMRWVTASAPPGNNLNDFIVHWTAQNGGSPPPAGAGPYTTAGGVGP